MQPILAALGSHKGPKDTVRHLAARRRVLMLEELFQSGLQPSNATLQGDHKIENLSDDVSQFIVLKSWERWKPSEIAVLF